MPLARSTFNLAAFAAPAALVFALTLALMVPSGSAEAACSCRCIDGKAQPVCSSSTDIRPFCQPASCPIAPPVKPPLDTRNPAPAVKPGCETKQVYDPETRAYTWEQICK